MNKTLLIGIATLLVPAVSFADDAARDDGPAAESVPHDGFRATVTIGAARAESTSVNLGTGGSVAGRATYEWMYGRLGVGVGFELEAQDFGDGPWSLNPPNSSVTLRTYAARPTASVVYYGDHFLPYASLGVGFMHAAGSVTTDTMSMSETDNMLSISASAGISYRITNRIALGPYVSYQPNFEPALNQFVDIGVSLVSH